MEDEKINLVYKANEAIRNASIGLILNAGITGWLVGLGFENIMRGRYDTAFFDAALTLLPVYWARCNYKILSANKEVLTNLASQNADSLESKVDGQ